MFNVLRTPCEGYSQLYNLHDMTNSTIEISKVRMQQQEWWPTCNCMYNSTRTGVGKWFHTLPSHPKLWRTSSFR